MINRQALPVPLLKVALAWCLGIVLAAYVSPRALPWVFGFTGALTGLAVLAPKSFRNILLLLLICGLGFLRTGLFPKPESGLAAVLESRPYLRQELEFRVLRLVSGEFYSYEVELQQLAGLRNSEHLLLYAGKELQGGATYKMLGEITRVVQDPLLDVFPGRFPAKVYPVGNITLLRPGAFSIASLRSVLMRNLEQNIGEGADFAKALLLSDFSTGRGFREELKRGGIIHLIVVSGLHVWLIYLVVMILLNFFLPKRLCELIFMVLITFFAALNNWAPPVLRSILMIALILVAKWLSRPVSAVQIMSASLIFITAYDPRQLFSVSLLLSYASLAIIILALPRFAFLNSGGKLRKWLSVQLNYVMISVLVGLGLLPVTLYFFGTGSLNGIVGNLIGIPLIGLIMPLAFLLMLIPPGFILLPGFRTSYLFLVSMFYKWTTFSASLPLYVRSRFLSLTQAWVLVLALLLLFLLLRGRWKVLRYGAVPGLLLMSVLLWLPPFLHKEEPRLELYNSGVSDCALLVLDDKQTIMIDTGGVFGSPAETGDLNLEQMLQNSWLDSKLLPRLARTGVKQIDWLILTHLHSDHMAGLAALCKAKKVRNIVVERIALESPVWQQLQREALFRNSVIHALEDTLSFKVGAARIRILHPDRNFYLPDPNNRSLVTKLEYRSHSYLFCGDLEAEGEEYLLQRYPKLLKADYLKVAHHGSKSSSTIEFLKAVRPREAWVTVSLRNRYHFPAPEVEARFRELGIKLRQTSTGTIVHPL